MFDLVKISEMKWHTFLFSTFFVISVFCVPCPRKFFRMQKKYMACDLQDQLKVDVLNQMK